MQVRQNGWSSAFLVVDRVEMSADEVFPELKNIYKIMERLLKTLFSGQIESQRWRRGIPGERRVLEIFF
jgi:hypothetical protein